MCRCVCVSVGRVSVVLLCPVLSSGRTGSEKFVHGYRLAWLLLSRNGHNWERRLSISVGVRGHGPQSSRRPAPDGGSLASVWLAGAGAGRRGAPCRRGAVGRPDDRL